MKEVGIMAANFYVEYNGMKAEEKNILEKIKTIWKDNGNKVKDMKKTDIYFKGFTQLFCDLWRLISRIY